MLSDRSLSPGVQETTGGAGLVTARAAPLLPRQLERSSTDSYNAFMTFPHVKEILWVDI